MASEREEYQHHFIGRVASYEIRGNEVRFDCVTNTGLRTTVRIEFCTPNVYRLQLIPESVNPQPSEIPIEVPSEPVEVEALETDEQIVLTTADTRLEINTDPWIMSIHEEESGVIWREVPEDFDVHQNRRSLLLGFTTNSEGDVVEVNETFWMDSDEHFYGLGEKFTDLDKRGQEITCWNVNPYGAGTEEAYKNIPFLLSTKSYGVFLNSTYKSVWEIGSRSNQAYSIRVEDEMLDLFLINGSSLKDVLGGYMDITGYPPLPPKWSMGMLQWNVSPEGKLLQNAEELVELCERMRDESIPGEMLALKPTWMGLSPGEYDLEFDEERFPDPEQFSNRLEELGFKLIGWVHPYIPVESELFAKAEAEGYLVEESDGTTYTEHLAWHFPDEWATSDDLPRWMQPQEQLVKQRLKDQVGENHLTDIQRSYEWRREHTGDHYAEGGIIDFTNPDAVDWWRQKISDLARTAFDSFMTDFGEESPVDGVYHNGKTGEEMYNFYSTLYQEATLDGLVDAGKDPFLRARSGYAGMQKYPTCWPGDPHSTFDDMAFVLRGGLNIGLSGVPFWMNGVSLFGGMPIPELFVRWLQCAVFASHCDGAMIGNPLQFDGEYVDLYRKFANLRYRLLPYIYTYAVTATETGIPPMRAMILEFEDDPVVHGIDSQFMFGEELLVAPILSESDDGSGRVTRPIYLPEGTWFDYWTNNRYEGPTSVDYEAPLDRIPIFVREDSLLPMSPERDYVGSDCFSTLVIDGYVEDSAEFTVRDVDGPVDVRCERRESETVVRTSGTTKNFRIRFNGIDTVRTVTVDGTEIPKQEDEPDDGECAWWVDPDRTCISFSGSENGTEISLHHGERGSSQ